MENKKLQISFAAIEKTLESNIPVLAEVDYKSKDFIYYGTDNMYPEYLYSLFNDVTTLKTVIEGIADYTAGNDASCNIAGFEFEINRKGMTMRELITALARDYAIYGGFAFQVVRNKLGNVSEFYYLDFRFCRTSKENDIIYYNEEFNKKWGRQNKTLVYPKFIPEAKEIPTSVVYMKNTLSSTYPIPRYSGAIKACEIERHIDDLHLNSLENGFLSSYLINFASGIPDDEQKSEIEKDITEKFTGTENAGRFILSFSNGRDNAAEVQKLDVTDFSEKYKAAAERSREQIYSAFRCIPQLFGNMTAATGFNSQEFEESFKVFNKTVIMPIQRVITDTFDKVFQSKNSVLIKTFSLNNEQNNVE